MYRSRINLDEDYTFNSKDLLSKINRTEIVDSLLHTLSSEEKLIPESQIPLEYENKRRLLRALLNKREPKPISELFRNKLKLLLQVEVMDRGVADVKELKPISVTIPAAHSKHKDKIVLWQGDITTLKVDAIVNAANNQMLGCFQPLHACIDNAIHSAAGPQLREDCQTIMDIQQSLENTGDAKITRAYNLPSKYVLHTVGPIVPHGTELNDEKKKQLASCYSSCLELASQISNIKLIAFCSISTGLFGFPKKEATEIAIATVNDWLTQNPNRFEKVIFNVFSKEDYNEYFQAFQK
ncbi:protein-ADP-ribose hydrolase [Cohnella sp. NL03-T5]|nr:protein-ADP-ribose hydrolase [Cohnella silvisoli]